MLHSHALLLAGALTFVAALAHVACIVLGPNAYRRMGAGERTARAVEAGRLHPAIITALIAAVLAVWGLYAFSGAGLVPALPWTRAVLWAVSGVFLVRAVAVPWLRPLFPENSRTFWVLSSGACLVLGLLYAAGAAGL